MGLLLEECGSGLDQPFGDQGQLGDGGQRGVKSMISPHSTTVYLV